MHILIVDDEDVIRRGCRMILEEQGHLVDACATCAEGIVALNRGRYDLLLLDMKLPDRNGTEILRTVSTGGRSQRVIVMSGFTMDGRRQDVGHARVDYLSKPFTDDELLAAIDSGTKRVTGR